MKILALDIGGTFIKYAQFEDNHLSNSGSIPTHADQGPKALLRTLRQLAVRFPDKEAVGISFASQVNPVEGRISSATETFPGFTGLPVKSILERDLKVPVTIDNDVNCAAVGEGTLGAAAGCPDFLCLTYGTGIGGAIILDGKLHYGQTFAAGEVGHMTLRAGGVRCNCGRLGCYEAYASTTALIRRVYAEHKLTLDGKSICDLCEQGNEGINETVNNWIGDVCAGLTSCIHMLNPPVVVLGGGIMENTVIFNRVSARLQNELLPNFRAAEIRQAQLGNTAGMIGAAIQAQALCTSR